MSRHHTPNGVEYFETGHAVDLQSLICQVDIALERAVTSGVESAVGEVGNRCPKVPEGKVIFRGEQCHVTVDAFVLFAVVRFGGKDWHHACIQQLGDDLAQVFGVTRFEVRAHLNDDK